MNVSVARELPMAFDIFMLCLIAAGYVLFVIGLLNDAARLIIEKIWRP
jgi:hypothetical protein